MADSFLDRIPTLSDAELRAYLDGHRKFRREAIEAAAAELRRRGFDVPAEELREIRQQVERRDAGDPRPPGFLWDGTGPRRERIRAIALGILGAGLACAAVLHHRAAVAARTGFDLEPADSKAYLRQLEMVGGKANLVASDFRHGFAALWQGTGLAYTVLGLAVATAAIFWLAATHGRTSGR